jgi:hypothetical protein
MTRQRSNSSGCQLGATGSRSIQKSAGHILNMLEYMGASNWFDEQVKLILTKKNKAVKRKGASATRHGEIFTLLEVNEWERKIRHYNSKASKRHY